MSDLYKILNMEGIRFLYANDQITIINDDTEPGEWDKFLFAFDDFIDEYMENNDKGSARLRQL